jgi:hypothetical protein
MSAGDTRAKDAATELSAVLEELGFNSQLREFPIFMYQPYWPYELLTLASPPYNQAMVLIVILDKPEPAV